MSRSNNSDRNLRNLDRVDYREPTEDSVEHLFDESTNSTLPVQNASDGVDPTEVSGETTFAAADVNDTEHLTDTDLAEASLSSCFHT